MGKTNVKTDKLTLTHEEGEKADLFLKAYLVKKMQFVCITKYIHFQNSSRKCCERSINI